MKWSTTPKQIRRKFWGFFFALLKVIKSEIGLTDVEIGWDQSTIILIKTSGRYQGDVEDRYTQMAKKIRSCFKDMLCLKQKDIEVFVTTKHLIQSGMYIAYLFVSISKCTLIPA